MEIVRKDVSLPKIYGIDPKDPKLAFTLDNVLTTAECEELIKETEDRGYEQALLNIGGGHQDSEPVESMQDHINNLNSPRNIQYLIQVGHI